MALLEQEEEVRRVLEKMKLLAKVEVAAAVTQEKCRQLQESRMMQIQLGALQSAFKTQSEDAKVSHSTHKLAMVQPYFIWKQKLWLLVKFTF
jgi:hypothetical protein